jgi:hypothetical protein
MRASRRSRRSHDLLFTCKLPIVTPRLSCSALLAILFVTAPAHAQVAQPAAGHSSALPSVVIRPDGRLDVTAAGQPLGTVIGAVARASGLDIRAVGDSPAEFVTVTFIGRSAAEILDELMQPAGVSYLISAGSEQRRGTLIMGRLSPGGPSLQAALAEQLAQPERETVPSDTIATASNTAQIAEPAAPQEWPSEVPPIGTGAGAPVPTTREELFQIVNGGPPVATQYTPPGAVTGSFGQGGKSGAPTSPNALQSVSRPGLTTGAPMRATPGPPAPPDPTMLQAPRTYVVPAPTVIEFPAPPPTP